ncbi:MAG: nuclear transport factor 2 family protein [Hyphomonadaceae bacterium]|nr:nuclear transport factor 2 family protein [Hyphomonadaceae bacterium]GIK48317.1 MAG: hypothetical protein BroJett013_10140 [Alphaproteobacteria bacterium]
MTRTLNLNDGPAFLALMKRYVMDYCNSHDQAVTESIMAPDYTLRMGDHLVSGRDTAYFDATRKQMNQFPGLVLTVHEIWTSGERLAMRFTEHGASLRHNGACAAWSGIGLYKWNGEQLTYNSVEQDYFSRARQLKNGAPNPVDHPAIAPWDGAPLAPDAAAEASVRAWLDSGALARTQDVFCDDAWTGVDTGEVLDQAGIVINDLFSCGLHVAFHATQYGRVRGDFDAANAGRNGKLHMAGIVHLESGCVAGGRIIRNRLDLQRDLAAAAP